MGIITGAIVTYFFSGGTIRSATDDAASAREAMRKAAEQADIPRRHFNVALLHVHQAAQTNSCRSPASQRPPLACARTAEYREEMQSRTPRSIPFSSRGCGGNTGGEEERNGEPGTTPRFLTSAPGGVGPDLRRLVRLRQRLQLRLKRRIDPQLTKLTALSPSGFHQA